MDIKSLDFKKVNGLMPAIIQDFESQKVLMLGYMDEKALKKTLDEEKVTFFSRTKNRLWTKGETSSNYLWVKDILVDCDKDTLLVKVCPEGEVCHKGFDTCFEEENSTDFSLIQLQSIIKDRKNNPSEKSYTTSLFKKGINKVAQKVGEEAVELVIEAKDDNKYLFLNEAADLMYHYLVLLQAKEVDLEEVLEILRSRHKK